MRQLAVLSGKGGTGKTTVLGSFAALAGEKVLVDADVEASNLFLLLRPSLAGKQEFFGAEVAEIDQRLCRVCAKCRRACRFDAVVHYLTGVKIDPLRCEGCCVCQLVCPQQAISLHPIVTGWSYLSATEFGPLSHARMVAGSGEASGKLVTELRRRAEETAREQGLDLLLIDGPPGVGCPVIAAVTGVDLVLIVTEPTLSGLADLKRVHQLTRHFKIPAVVCINKYDLNLQTLKQLEAFCEGEALQVLARIPFDAEVEGAIAAARPLVKVSHGPAATAIRSLWAKVWQWLQ